MTSGYTKDEILKVCRDDLNDIDKCIANLIKSRLNADKELEQKTLCEMEKLICGIQQDLTVVYDYINGKE